MDRMKALNWLAISIHAPARGATCTKAICFYEYGKFQSTLPRGERPSIPDIIPSAKSISIHAPARGATLPRSQSQWESSLFQSTLPRGERLHIFKFSTFSTDFNPRSREGSDGLWKYEAVESIKISIHAPARGATFYKGCIPDDLEISIHAPARGATESLPICFCINEFQSTLPRGERLCHHGNISSVDNDFNPRSREGSD